MAGIKGFKKVPLEILLTYPRSRKEAKKLGSSRYFKNEICPNGHLDYRITSNYECRVCRWENDRKYLSTEHGRLKVNAKVQRYRDSESGKAAIKLSESCIKRKIAKKNTTLKYSYGLTLEKYNELIQKQENRCGICEKEFISDQIYLRPEVDHCHNSSFVRSILCKRCNMGIGHFEHDPKVLLKAYDYLNNHKQIINEKLASSKSTSSIIN